MFSTSPIDILVQCILQSSLHKLFSGPVIWDLFPFYEVLDKTSCKADPAFERNGADVQIPLHYPSQKLCSGPQDQMQWSIPTLVKNTTLYEATRMLRYTNRPRPFKDNMASAEE